MEGLEQVHEDPGCWESPAAQRAPYTRGHHGGRPVDQERSSRKERIARTIESEVVPRLLLAHRSDLRPPRDDVDAVAFDARTPERFARVVLENTEAAAMDFIYRLIAGNFPLESVYLDLLGPAARWIGGEWEEDRLTFAEVTIGLARLQRVMRTLNAAPHEVPSETLPAPGLVLFAAMPGEQHMFGVLILEEFARRAGLDVDCMPTCAREELLDTVARRAPAVIGLSVSVDAYLEDLRQLVSEIRARSPNPDLVVMVGGRCMNDRPDAVRFVGADLTAVDGREAILQIHDYLSSSRDNIG